MFVVIESTPGYLPEDTDPATFDDYAEAVAYLNERAGEYADDPDGNYRVEYGIASGDNLAAVIVWDDSKAHDLGRVIEILRGECEHNAVVTCGICDRSWCEDEDPAPAALCHYCHGRGYSTAPR